MTVEAADTSAAAAAEAPAGAARRPRWRLAPPQDNALEPESVCPPGRNACGAGREGNRAVDMLPALPHSFALALCGCGTGLPSLPVKRPEIRFITLWRFVQISSSPPPFFEK